MATKTDEVNLNCEYKKQRSNSDPQPELAVLNALNNERVKVKKKSSTLDKKKNGEMKTGSLNLHTPPPERKSRFAALGKLFKPWKWKRKKKSEKIEKTAVELERKISVRLTREELINKGVLKEREEPPQNHVHISSENTECIKESPDEENTDSLPEKPEENGCLQGDGTRPIVTSASDSTLITTTADITPSSTCSTTTVSAAQVRPVVITTSLPHVAHPEEPSQQETKPPPSEPVMTVPAYAPPPPPPFESHAVTFDNSSVIIGTSTNKYYDNDDDDEDGDGEDSEDEDSQSPPQVPGCYEVVPADIPDLSKRPQKSALKAARMENGRISPVTPQMRGLSSGQTVLTTTPNTNSNASTAQQSVTTPSTGFVPRVKVRVKPTAQDDDSPDEVPRNHQSHFNDDSSSDDEEIKYRDDEMDPNSLAAKVARQDSLARFLSNRPTRKELVDKNIIPGKSEQEKIEDKQAIGSKLTRRLSLRPTPEELQQKNILHHQTEDAYQSEKEEKKRFLIRKLSFRPSVEELKERKIIKFNDYIEMTDANEYDRKADKPWTRLTPKDKAAIRKELNEFKSKEMDVHEDSRHLTRFHRP